MRDLTTFIIPSKGRDTLQRAIKSAEPHGRILHKIDTELVGPATMRNLMIAEADTEWVSFLDDDDTVTADYTEKFLEEIAAHPEADIIHFREYFPMGNLLPTWPEVAWGNIGICFAIKRQIALDNPFRDEKYEDYHFVRRIVEKGHTIHFSKHVLYHVRH